MQAANPQTRSYFHSDLSKSPVTLSMCWKRHHNCSVSWCLPVTGWQVNCSNPKIMALSKWIWFYSFVTMWSSTAKTQRQARSRGHQVRTWCPQPPRGRHSWVTFLDSEQTAFLLGCPVGAPGDNQSTLGRCSLEGKLSSFPCHRVGCNFRKDILISYSQCVKIGIIIRLMKSSKFIKSLQFLQSKMLQKWHVSRTAGSGPCCSWEIFSKQLHSQRDFLLSEEDISQNFKRPRLENNLETVKVRDFS